MRRRFRRLRAASDFARGGKVTKTPPGTAPDEYFVLIVAFPRTPLRGTRTCWILQHFRRAKSEWRSEISTGPLRRRGFRIPRFARTGQSSLTPSLLLSNANPLRWALRWGPPSAACWTENFEWCGSTTAPGFAEPTLPVRFRRRGGTLGRPGTARWGHRALQKIKRTFGYVVGAGALTRPPSPVALCLLFCRCGEPPH